MPRCPLCTTDPANPIWHRSMKQCPKRTSNVLPKAGVTVSSPPPAQQAAGPPGKPIDETKPASAPAAPPKKRLLSFLTKSTEKIADDVSKPKKEFDWILPEEANARLWQSGLSFLRQTLNLFNRFMGMPAIPDDLMRFGKSDLDSINEAFRAPTSKFLYTMGFRTAEEAVRFTLVFSGFSLFGLMFVQLALFYWENLPKAERFKKWREKQQMKALQFKERLARERAARQQGAPTPPGLTAGVPG